MRATLARYQGQTLAPSYGLYKLGGDDGVALVFERGAEQQCLDGLLRSLPEQEKRDA